MGGSIELGSSGTPYVDFKNLASDDYDIRLRLTSDNDLTVEGGNLGGSDPTANGHFATKSYVDAATAGAGADNLGNHTATTTLNMANNAITGTNYLSFNASANHRIATNASGLLFNGGEGSYDFLIYDDSIYTDVIRTGYTGTAQITTYDSGEDLQLTSNGGDVYVNDNM